jgi:hypothetical protein
VRSPCSAFFGGPDLGLKTAFAGTFGLNPSLAMHDALRRDYEARKGMIFREVPALDVVLVSIKSLDARVNPSPSKPIGKARPHHYSSK